MKEEDRGGDKNVGGNKLSISKDMNETIKCILLWKIVIVTSEEKR